MNPPAHPVDNNPMRPPRNTPPLPIQAFADNRRRRGRLRCAELLCHPLGEVEDLSASGVRVLRHGRGVGRVEDRFMVRLVSGVGPDTVSVKTRIIRIEKLGFRRYSYGLEFLDVDEQTRAQLTALMRIATEMKLLA